MKKINFLTHQLSFNRDGFSSVVSKQFILYLIFDYVIITQEFNPSPYFRKLSEDNKKLHNKIKELQNKGWGYTKIHTYLRKNGYKIGKSRTTVDSIINKSKVINNIFVFMILVLWFSSEYIQFTMNYSV